MTRTITSGRDSSTSARNGPSSSGGCTSRRTTAAAPTGGRYAGRAVDLLTSGLDGLPPGGRASDWVGSYVVDLAVAYEHAGARPEAEAALGEARQIAVATGSGRLLRQVDGAVRTLSARR